MAIPFSPNGAASSLRGKTARMGHGNRHFGVKTAPLGSTSR